MVRLLSSAFALCLVTAQPLIGQTDAGTVPSGTPLVVVLDRNYPMRVGSALSGSLMYPIYAANKLVLPRGAAIEGNVVALHPDHPRRLRAALGGDFTPFHTPEIRFNGISLADGSVLPIATALATDGAPVYQAVAPPPAKGGLLRREFDAGLSAARSDLATFTAPGKTDRLLQFVYDRLPYHPQRIAAGTAWTVETAAPFDVPAQPAEATPPPAPERKRHFWEEPVPPTADTTSGESGTWIVKASLDESLSSEESHAGQAIQAIIAEPIYAADHTLAVPQGATLTGTVTRAKRARSFGRTGVLSFNFTQLTLPDSAAQTIETRLTGADTAAQIALNSEGQVTSKPQDKVTIPLILALMASRPLDTDQGRANGSHDGLGKNAAGGAAGLSVVGTIVAAAGGSPYVAAGIGYWGAARAVYSRWIARGQKIAFPRDTRIVVETTPRRSSPLKPAPRP